VTGLAAAIHAEARKVADSRVVRSATVFLVAGIAVLAGTLTWAAGAGNEQVLARLGPLAPVSAPNRDRVRGCDRPGDGAVGRVRTAIAWRSIRSSRVASPPGGRTMPWWSWVSTFRSPEPALASGGRWPSCADGRQIGPVRPYRSPGTANAHDQSRPVLVLGADVPGGGARRAARPTGHPGLLQRPARPGPAPPAVPGRRPPGTHRAEAHHRRAGRGAP
jgi:hypothetical protein